MNNFNTFNNCLKIISILIFVFIILKYVVVMSSTESIILATIITVTIILIENLLFKNIIEIEMLIFLKVVIVVK